MNRSARQLYTLLLLLCACTAAAQKISDRTMQWSVRHFTDKEGLPQNSVKFLAPDKHGFLWLATENGLVRFDGRQFLTFNSANLPIRTDRMKFVFAGEEEQGIRVATELHEMLAVRNGVAAIDSSVAKRYAYMKKRPEHGPSAVHGLPDRLVAHLARNIMIYAAGPDAWFEVLRDTISFIQQGKMRYRFTIPGLQPSNLVVIDGRLCRIGENDRITVYDGTIPRQLMLTGDILQHPMQYREVYWNVVSKQVFLYGGSRCYQLRLLPGGRAEANMVLDDFDFVRNGIISAYYDSRARRFFLGSMTKGLFEFTARQFFTLKAGAEMSEVYYAQAPLDGNGIVTSAGVVFEQDGARLIPLVHNNHAVSDNYTLMCDAAGAYWFKSGSSITRLNNRLDKVLNEYDMGETVTQLHRDKSGRYWVGGRETGLYLLDTVAMKPVLFTTAIRSVAAIHEETPAILWFGTRDGLMRMQMPSGRVDTMHALDGRYVRSIYSPHAGEVWITTHNHGIYLLRNGRFTHLPLDRRKFIAAAHCIVKDERDYLWVTTNNGLFQFSRKDALAYAAGEAKGLFYQYYGKSQGLNTNEFNGGCEPCALRLADGTYSFPSLDGLVLVDPTRVNAEQPDGDIFIDHVEVDTQLVASADEILLPHRFKQFKLHFSTPYFGEADNLHFYYSLQPAGSKEPELWLPANMEQTIELSRLASGVYDLHIKKLNGFGKDNMSLKTLHLRVQQVFYETLWFRLLAGGSLLAVFGFGAWRIRKTQQRNRQLKMQVVLRMRDQSRTLRHLRKSEAQLRKQGYLHQRLLAAISHDIKTPLNFLVSVVGKGVPQQQAIAGEERVVVHESLRSILHIVSNLVQYIKSQYLADGEMPVVTDLHALVEEKIAVFRPVAAAKGISLHNHTQAPAEALANRQLLTVIVHNLLDNAVKYTVRGGISVTVTHHGNRIGIRVSDTGMGMPEHIMAWVNSYGSNGGGVENHGGMDGGLGLMIVLELVQLMNGRVAASNVPGGGTCFELDIPSLS